MDSEIIMKNGEPVGTQGPTGHYVLLDAHFQLPSGHLYYLFIYLIVKAKGRKGHLQRSKYMQYIDRYIDGTQPSIPYLTSAPPSLLRRFLLSLQVCTLTGALIGVVSVLVAFVCGQM